MHRGARIQSLEKETNRYLANSPVEQKHALGSERGLTSGPLFWPGQNLPLKVKFIFLKFHIWYHPAPPTQCHSWGGHRPNEMTLTNRPTSHPSCPFLCLSSQQEEPWSSWVCVWSFLSASSVIHPQDLIASRGQKAAPWCLHAQELLVLGTARGSLWYFRGPALHLAPEEP